MTNRDNMIIPFHKPYKLDQAKDYILKSLDTNQILGDQFYSKKCEEILQSLTLSNAVKLTTSCTHALEMSALLLNIKPGDEVIVPSFTFSSTATAFLLRGARLKYVDVDETLNINASIIERAISSKTKAIVPVHYAGISCDMDPIMELAKLQNIKVVEDAAQSLFNNYKGRALGSIGDMGCFSFHGTKNITSGEGGAITINDEELIARADIIRQKGTNRAAFFKGQVDKYGWVDQGSSYTPSDILAALLLSQLELGPEITKLRRKQFYDYCKNFKSLEDKGFIKLPVVPNYTDTNGHIFYFILNDKFSRDEFIQFMKKNGISTTFHFQALHKSIAGQKYGDFVGEDNMTSKVSDQIVRLPIFASLTSAELTYVTQKVFDFFKETFVSNN